MLLQATAAVSGLQSLNFWDITLILMFVFVLIYVGWQSYTKGGLIFFFQTKMIAVFMALASGSTLLEIVSLTSGAVARGVPFAAALARFTQVSLLEIIPALIYMAFLDRAIAYASYRGRVDERTMKSIGLQPKFGFVPMMFGYTVAVLVMLFASALGTSALGALYIETLTGQTITLPQGVRYFYQALSGDSVDVSGFEVKIEIGAILVIYSSVVINLILLILKLIYFELMQSDIERIKEEMDYEEEANKNAETLKKEPYFAAFLKRKLSDKSKETKDSGGNPKDPKAFSGANPSGKGSEEAEKGKEKSGEKDHPKSIIDKFNESKQGKKDDREGDGHNFDSWLASSDGGGTGVQTSNSREKRAKHLIDMMREKKVVPADMNLASKLDTLLTPKNVALVLGPKTDENHISFTEFDKVRFALSTENNIDKRILLNDMQQRLLSRIQLYVSKND